MSTTLDRPSTRDASPSNESNSEEARLTQELEDTLAQFLMARKTFHQRCYQDLLTMQQICADLEKFYMD